jgi:acetyl esterase/lipase
MILPIATRRWLGLGAIIAISLPAWASSTDPQSSEGAVPVPPKPPRTMVVNGRQKEFRAYCTTGDGAKAFAKIKADFDREYLAFSFPDEPVTYGDPDPKERDSDKADKWRNVQDICGRVSGIAEAATIIWIATGEQKYFAKAKEFLLKSCAWHFEPDWKSGPVAGATDIYYNDEANFRLWRKLPLVYDQLRLKLTPEEKKIVLAHFKQRGDRTVKWIKAARVEKLKRNSLEVNPSSHPVRFMSMVGLTGLALWDDLPEAREWWRFAYGFYRDQFSPWGGDDGGWAEGNAYWRGTFEHAAFQDALLAIGDPTAYSSPFWRNSPFFALYNVQPYLHTIFGDTSNAGRFNLEPSIADYMEHLARVQQNGYFRAYAALCTDKRPRPSDKGLAGLDRTYPTACEFLIRNFIASDRPLPPARPLSELPPYRFFRDVGWVSLHSALGRPDDDIQITFKSSPYGSFSHSHADQNAFILNAYGESLAINSAYREFHGSPHHKDWTRQTKSKNALLINGLGQKAQDKKATGKITRYEIKDRYVWTTGDATVAYKSAQNGVQCVTRDLVFIDQRYVVVRDHVELAAPGKLSWLLHAEKNLTWDETNHTAVIRGEKAALTAQLVAPGVSWRGRVTDQFPVPIDPKYVEGEVGDSYVTGKWTAQQHLTVDSSEPATNFTVFAVLWPERDSPVTLTATLRDGVLRVNRPDGKTDNITLTDTALEMSAAALDRPIETVVDKKRPSPTGDAHDYVSYGRYWWPDPASTNGLPFIRRDGHPNREQMALGDQYRLWQMIETVESLAQSWQREHCTNCAVRAGEWIRAWFVTPATRVNPAFEYAQIRLGHNNNRGSASGLIDTRGFIRLIESLRRLQGSPALTGDDEKQIRQWFSDYLHWLTTSKNGKQERAAGNNHGSWLLAQLIAISRYLGREEQAREFALEDFARIENQFAPDGSQPLEMVREDGLGYCVFNLEAQLTVAQLAAPLGVDVWNYAATNGASLRRGLEFLIPYNNAPETWPHHQWKKLEPGFLNPLLAQAAQVWTNLPAATPATIPGAETFVYREPMRLHVFKPKDWKAGDQRPALVFFFGGGWTRGTPERSAGYAKWAATLGMVGIAPDYRVKERFGTSPLESVADGRAALRWIEDHADELGIDPKKIVVGGSSAGGHVALWTAIEHTPPGSAPHEAPRVRPAALILVSPVSDTSAATGYTPKRFGDNTEALSPVHQLDAKMPPVLVFHGDADTTVPNRQSIALTEKLVATGNVGELITVPGGNHGFQSQLPEWKDKSRAIMKDFLARHGILPVTK